MDVLQHEPSLDESMPQTIDGKTGKPVPTPRTINLSNLRDVRLEMAYGKSIAAT